MRLFVIPLLLMASLCRVSLDIQTPFGADSTPTQEVSITLTPQFVGSVTPVKNDVNVRGCPSTQCPIVTTLRYGGSMAVRSIGSDWYQVELPNIGTAWVAKQVVVYKAK